MRTGSKKRAAFFTALSLGALAILYSIAMNVVIGAGPRYEIEFNHVGTINRGTVVSKLGIKIGAVVGLEFHPETRSSVIVTVQLDRDQVLRQDERFAILTRGLFGDQTVEVYPGSVHAPVAPPGTRFQGEPTVDLASIMADGGRAVQNVGETSELLNSLLQRNAEMVDQVVLNVERFTFDLSEISGGTKDMILALDRLEQELTEGIPDIIGNIRSASGRADTLLESIDTVVSESELAETITTIQRAAAELARLGASLSEEDSTLSRLQGSATGDRIEEILANLAELSDNLRVASEGIKLVFQDMEDE